MLQENVWGGRPSELGYLYFNQEESTAMDYEIATTLTTQPTMPPETSVVSSHQKVSLLEG